MKVKVKCSFCGAEQVREVDNLQLLGMDYCRVCLTVASWGTRKESRKPALEVIEVLKEE